MRLDRLKFRMVFTGFFFLFLLFVTEKVYSATYHVAKIGNDSTGNGTATNPWLTIGRCASLLAPGDTCMISAGLYEEAIKPANSGTPGNPITFAAKPGDLVTVRQFLLNSRDYIRVVGFLLTHNSTTYYGAIQMNNSHHCEVFNNTFQHLYGPAVKNYQTTGRSNYNLVRGNTISYPGCPEGLAGQCMGSAAIILWGDYNVIEYNDISQSSDSFNTNGRFVFIRNNYIHDQRNTDFPDRAPDSIHIDFWQAAVYAGAPNARCFIERNFSTDNIELNSHFFQHRDIMGAGDQEILLRGNVGMRMGSYAAQFGAVDKVRIYHNTFSDFYYGKTTKGSAAIIFMPEGEDLSTDNRVLNNIFHKTSNPTSGTVLGLVGTGSTVIAANNVCLESGVHASCVATSNVNFVNYSEDDLHLQEISSARNAGKPITTVTSSTGSGTSFTVIDAGFLTDGAQVVTGDSIRVGSGTPVTITAVNYETNTVTVGENISWKLGAGVSLSHQNTDIGAYPYKSNDFKYDIQITSPADGATVGSETLISALVSNEDNVRFVIFYVDGIPVTKMEKAPYVFTWNTNGLEKRKYQVEARAYSYYADRVLSRSSKINLSLTDALISPPTELRPVTQ